MLGCTFASSFGAQAQCSLTVRVSPRYFHLGDNATMHAHVHRTKFAQASANIPEGQSFAGAAPATSILGKLHDRPL